MGKLVIKFQGKVVSEANLKLGDTTIGRKPGSDIVLDDAVVSSEHAVIKTVGMKATLHDLDSTNGTFVENHKITQHQLKNGETIIIGGYSMVYRDEAVFEAAAFGSRPAAPVPASAPQRKTTVIAPFAQLIAVEGKDKGKSVPLVKDVVTLDNPGKSAVRICRIREGYVFEASIGPGEPRLNGKPVPPGGHMLESGDLVEIAGTTYQFST